jgi:magnesium-transporting ATPase (P-type)
MQQVFITLRCSKEGLSSGEAQQRTAIFGPNKLEEKKVRHMHMQFSSLSSQSLFICCLFLFYLFQKKSLQYMYNLFTQMFVPQMLIEYI